MIRLHIKGVPDALNYMLRKSQRALSLFNEGVYKAALHLSGEVKESIAGRRDETRSVDTGRFMSSVKAERINNGAAVSSDVEYAAHLEYGTYGGKRIKPRRHFHNSLERERDKFPEIIRKEVAKA